MNLDGDPIRYPLISKRYKVLKHGPFSLATANVLSGSDGFFRKGDVMSHMTLLFQRGTSFPSHEQTEIGRWNHRDLCQQKFDFFVSDDTYYAWVDPDLWDYEPHLVLYTKDEFKILFKDCCRNYVAAHPERKEEFAAALAANGMSLNS